MSMKAWLHSFWWRLPPRVPINFGVLVSVENVMRNLYLGRLSDTEGPDQGDYELGTNLRKFDPQSGWDISSLVTCLCAAEVHKLTNLGPEDLKPGTVRKVKITLELL